MATIHQQLQSEIQHDIQHLPEQALKEVKCFIDALNARKQADKTAYPHFTDHELRRLDLAEALHLEDEFASYRDIYPHES